MWDVFFLSPFVFYFFDVRFRQFLLMKERRKKKERKKKNPKIKEKGADDTSALRRAQWDKTVGQRQERAEMSKWGKSEQRETKETKTADNDAQRKKEIQKN